MEVTEKIRGQLNTWTDVLTPFINSTEWDELFKFLKNTTQVQKKVVCPASADVFKSLALCDREKVKAVVVLQDPYATVKEGKIVADGIPMNCKNTGIPQPSIEHWYHAIEESYHDGFSTTMVKDNDLSYLLTEEHVLLINSSWTTEKDKSGSHAKEWMPFMTYLMQVINDNYRALPIVLCGNQAQKYEKYIDPLRHYIIKCEHMAAASYANRAWDYGNLFKKVNQIIKNNNGAEYEIQWYRERGVEKPTTSSWEELANLPTKVRTDINWESDLPW